MKRIDLFQQSHKSFAFTYGVIKKYDEDGGGYQAALLTYYGFLALFPLLLVATSILQIFLHSHPEVKTDILKYATQYFPIIGEQLQTNIKTINGAGFALAIGVLLTLWGAKGIADVFQYSMNHIWQIPKVRRPGFPRAAFKSIIIIFIGGVAIIIAAFLSGFAASLDKGIFSRIIPIIISVTMLFAVFWFIFKLGLAYSSHISKKVLFVSAITAAVGIQTLQVIGGYLITHELGKLTNAYGAFAVALGLLFYIYLQARIIIYAIEVGSVYGKKLWPRSITQDKLTHADEIAIKDFAKKEKVVIPQDIRVGFKSKK